MATAAPSGWVDRQLPEGDEVFLDHVGYFVPDLDLAAHKLKRLGFQVSDVNIQYNVNAEDELILAGTANRLVLLQRGFIEALAAISSTPLAAQLQTALARYQGLHVVALTHADMTGQRQRLIQAGFAMQQVVNLRRRIETPAGERQMAYSVLRPEPGEMAEGRIQMLTNHTPKLLWTPSATRHENQVEALTDLLICVHDSETAATRYSHYTGRPVEDANGCKVITLDRGRIILVDPARAARMVRDFTPPAVPYIVGFGLRSVDLKRTLRVLTRAGIEPSLVTGSLICVPPSEALGAYLLFHASWLNAPWLALRASLGCVELTP